MRALLQSWQDKIHTYTHQPAKSHIQNSIEQRSQFMASTMFVMSKALSLGVWNRLNKYMQKNMDQSSVLWEFRGREQQVDGVVKENWVRRRRALKLGLKQYLERETRKGISKGVGQ